MDEIEAPYWFQTERNEPRKPVRTVEEPDSLNEDPYRRPRHRSCPWRCSDLVRDGLRQPLPLHRFSPYEVETTGSLECRAACPREPVQLPDELGRRGQRQPAELPGPAVRPDLGREPLLIGPAKETTCCKELLLRHGRGFCRRPRLHHRRFGPGLPHPVSRAWTDRFPPTRPASAAAGRAVSAPTRRCRPPRPRADRRPGTH